MQIKFSIIADEEILIETDNSFGYYDENNIQTELSEEENDKMLKTINAMKQILKLNKDVFIKNKIEAIKSYKWLKLKKLKKDMLKMIKEKESCNFNYVMKNMIKKGYSPINILSGLESLKDFDIIYWHKSIDIISLTQEGKWVFRSKVNNLEVGY